MKEKEDTYNFQQFSTIRSFARNSFSGKITLDDADDEQVKLLTEIMDFKEKRKPKNFEKNNIKKIIKKVLNV